ncbi:CPBP family intramembrane glutamic endopeptidase [Dyadobacter sp. 32]|uniref:CPBP family intramembrane glutamic endopeptidase n=1 Tax=Dyadobacter sp. 32 TaxID=538966 RepID=UPI0011EE969B
MQKSSSNVMQSRAPGVLGSLLVLIGFVLVGMAVGNILAVFIIAVYTNTPAGEATDLLNRLLNAPDQVENAWNAMMILQGTVHFFSYLLPCLLFWRYIERRTLSDFSDTESPASLTWLQVFILVLVFIPLNSQFIEWNSQMTFPEAMSRIEKWMRDKEDQLAVLTTFLTKYDRPGQLFIALIVVVLLPAIGEEMLFRGIIQRKFMQQLNNPHLAIWISAAIFSAIHFQFYGFVPRMLLGALFGYLYYWTGSLWIAVFAHFVNNGFVLIMMFLYNIKVLDINLEETKTMPLAIVLTSLALSFLTLFVIRKEALKRRELV